MIKAGRYTAALLLVIVGGSLLLDQSMGTDFVGKLFDWWPLLLVSLGAEYLLFSTVFAKEDRHLKLDFGGVFIAVIISVAVIAATQASSISLGFLDNISIGDFSFSDESGEKFDKGTTTIPLSENTDKVFLQNPNGKVVVKEGNVDQIQIKTTLYVSKLSNKKAEEIADQSKIEYSKGSTLKIEAKGKEYRIYGLKHKPRMNMEITVPEDRKVDMEFKLTNGKIEASRLPIKNKLKLHSVNGSITVSDIDGQLEADTTNGAIDVEKIKGKVELDSTNGSIKASHIDGDLFMDTTNGSVRANQVSGKVKADTTNGAVNIIDVNKEVIADTTNGSVTVKSGIVGGDWELDTTNGAINIYVPESGDYEVDGSAGFGSISSELPFTVSKKHIEGTIGSGKHKIKIDTNRGIHVYKYGK